MQIRRLISGAAVILLLVGVLVGCGIGVAEGDDYDVSGRVVSVLEDGVEPVEGASVKFSDDYSTVTTDEDGRWSKRRLEEEVTISVAKEDWVFYPNKKTVSEANDDIKFEGSDSVYIPKIEDKWVEEGEEFEFEVAVVVPEDEEKIKSIQLEKDGVPIKEWTEDFEKVLKKEIKEVSREETDEISFSVILEKDLDEEDAEDEEDDGENGDDDNGNDKFEEFERKVTIIVEKLHDLRGEVVDVDGNPISGAEVIVKGEVEVETEEEKEYRATASTDSSGEYKLRAPAAEEAFTITYSHEDYRDLRRKAKVTDDGFKLPEQTNLGASVLVGRITDESGGEGLEDVKVEVEVVHSGEKISVTTDSGGYYGIGVPATKLEVEISKDDYESISREMRLFSGAEKELTEELATE